MTGAYIGILRSHPFHSLSLSLFLQLTRVCYTRRPKWCNMRPSNYYLLQFFNFVLFFATNTILILPFPPIEFDTLFSSPKVLENKLMVCHFGTRRKLVLFLPKLLLLLWPSSLGSATILAFALIRSIDGNVFSPTHFIHCIACSLLNNVSFLIFH